MKYIYLLESLSLFSLAISSYINSLMEYFLYLQMHILTYLIKFLKTVHILAKHFNYQCFKLGSSFHLLSKMRINLRNKRKADHFQNGRIRKSKPPLASRCLQKMSKSTFLELQKLTKGLQQSEEYLCRKTG